MSWPGLWERLEGRLVLLEPLSREHEQALRAAASDARIWKWTRLDLTGGPGAFDRWFEAALDAARDGVEAPYATIDRRAGHLVGSTRYLTLRPEHRGLEIGYTWLEPRSWQSGINVEAKLLMLEHAFDQLGCMRVEFKTDARNERSRRALEALPAQFEGVFRKHAVLEQGRTRDSAYYSVIEDEWPAVRASLERRLAEKLQR